MRSVGDGQLQLVLEAPVEGTHREVGATRQRISSEQLDVVRHFLAGARPRVAS